MTTRVFSEPTHPFFGTLTGRATRLYGLIELVKRALNHAARPRPPDVSTLDARLRRDVGLLPDIDRVDATLDHYVGRIL